MPRYTEAQMAKKSALKAARSAIRTKHSIAADYEINDVLSTLEERIDNAQLTGVRLELSVGEIFEKALDGKTIDDAPDN